MERASAKIQDVKRSSDWVLMRKAMRDTQLGNIRQKDLNEDNRSQALAFRIGTSYRYQIVINCIIVAHMVLAVKRTDDQARGTPPSVAEQTFDVLFVVTYVCDLAIRIIAARSKFFVELMNFFDISIVIVDACVSLTDLITGDQLNLGPLAILRALRSLRIVRVIRNFSQIRDLYLMLKGMVYAMKAVLWAFLLISVFLTVCSMAAVDLLHPVNQRLAEEGVYDDCAWCDVAFSSVMNANLTFFSSILAGDSWGMLAIPLIKANGWTALVLITAFVLLQLGLLNVIVGVIVDRQAQAREDDKALQHAIKQENFEATVADLMEMFENLDDDASGTLSYFEMHRAYRERVEFRYFLQNLDIGEEDLDWIWNSMDRERKGTVDYEEFTAEMYKLRNMEIRTLGYFTRQHLFLLEDTLADLGQTITRDVVNQVVQRFEKMQFSDGSPWTARPRDTETSGPNQSLTPPAYVRLSTSSNAFAESTAADVPSEALRVSTAADCSASKEALQIVEPEQQFAALQMKVSETALMSLSLLKGAGHDADCEQKSSEVEKMGSHGVHKEVQELPTIAEPQFRSPVLVSPGQAGQAPQRGGGVSNDAGGSLRWL